MSQDSPVILIIEAKDGSKYQGTFVSKDTQKLTLTLSNVVKTFEGKEEQLSTYEIKKEDIGKISMLDNTPKKEEIQNANGIPEAKMTQNSLDNVEKAYDQTQNFFDNLKTTTKNDMKDIAYLYNKKNTDTFKLPENRNNNWNRGRGRGNRGNYRGNNRGNNRGNRGGFRGNRGGFNQQNKFNNYNSGFNNNYNNYPMQQQNYNYNLNGKWNWSNVNNQGFNRGNNYRGRGRGNYRNNNYNSYNRGNTQNNNFRQNGYQVKNNNN